jgi:PEP-utilising enzyme, PEP-binding domain
VRAAAFDGFSIGSNDLAQLTLGVDRDSEIVAFDFDERDPCMSEMLRLAVAGTKRNGRHVGICGEAPAKFRRSLNFSPASVSVAASEGNIAAASGGPTIGADKDWAQPAGDYANTRYSTLTQINFRQRQGAGTGSR